MYMYLLTNPNSCILYCLYKRHREKVFNVFELTNVQISIKYYE